MAIEHVSADVVAALDETSQRMQRPVTDADYQELARLWHELTSLGDTPHARQTARYQALEAAIQRIVEAIKQAETAQERKTA
jgi:predicted component of type VI protein secretion system